MKTIAIARPPVTGDGDKFVAAFDPPNGVTGRGETHADALKDFRAKTEANATRAFGEPVTIVFQTKTSPPVE